VAQVSLAATQKALAASKAEAKGLSEALASLRAEVAAMGTGSEAQAQSFAGTSGAGALRPSMSLVFGQQGRIASHQS